MSDTVRLYIDNRAYFGWKSVRIRRSLDYLAGSFELSLTDRWTPDMARWTILPGQPCRIDIGLDTVLTGYIDSVAPSGDGGSHTIRASGRDKTCDLVDCSAIHSPAEWKNTDIRKLVSTLVDPFGISVRYETPIPTEKFTFKLESGESPFDALDRMCANYALRMVSTSAGELAFRSIGDQVAAASLLYGKNIKSYEGGNTITERYSRYIVQSESSADASESWGSSSKGTLKAEATDEAITRYRPLLITGDGIASKGAAQKRANWEALTRAANANTATVTVQGWRQGPLGDLWDINLLVPTSIAPLRIDERLLIKEVELQLDDSNGSTTRLALVRSDAYRRLVKKTVEKEGFQWR